jgi:Tfp pilus assembly protein PilF
MPGLKYLRRALDEVAECLRSDRNEEALRVCRRALGKFGPSPPLLTNCGLALHNLGRYEEALDVYGHATRSGPSSAVTYNNRCSTLMRLDRLDEALVDADRALALDRTLSEAWQNRGVILQHLNRLDEAVSSHRNAITHDNVCAAAHLNKAFCHLVREQFVWGWEEYGWRWLTEGYASVKFREEITQARWAGECPAGKTLFLWREQGLGDTIMFSRYCALLREWGARVILWCQPEVRPLFTGFGVELWDPEFAAEETKTPPHDYQSPLGDLPRLCGTSSIPLIPRLQPIHAAPGLVAMWRERLSLGYLNVGVAWSGNPDHANDTNRSVALREFLRGFEGLGDGLRLVALQRDCREGDREALAASRVQFFGREVETMADCAAIAHSMDLIVTVDTAFAHLGGAMQMPTVVLLPFHPDWRWFLDRADSPWYPSVTLLRQHSRRDWSRVLSDVNALLRARVAR